ncbi:MULTISPECIES: flavodoxin domain-containing protein [Haloferax]|uniref:Protoporphyrinogen oxidase n=1 Tax=Haloferax marinum TaxID=2666143 RepID=A0A6A8G949_9EURY|nr:MULTISPECIES: flavodoxin domain-containing protein [Haloferax]KAB1198310.1 protoporphyrinogen oxidase [Haloferax sp. CBA1150]MRW97407.1 protoporphyrinogen oxidase [Haloferax marinum]
MASILVVYGSGEGQTQKVAEHVEDVLSDRGHDVTVRRVTERGDVVVEEFDAVLVGSPVNNRRHRLDVVEFVESNREVLATRPNGFFQLSLASTVPLRWAQDGARQFVDSLVTKTGWHPEHVGRFAGAVKYSQYDPLQRAVFKLVSAVTTGDTDTSRDYEYTDWNEVEAFATTFAEDVERRLTASIEETEHAGTVRLSWVAAGIALLFGVAGVAYWATARQFTPTEC